MRTELISGAGSWLLTYLLHSTLLLGLVWLVCRRAVQSPESREVLWKAALLGGLVTATLQSALGFEPLGGAVALSPAEAVVQNAAGDDAWRGLLQDSPGNELETIAPAEVHARAQAAEAAPPVELSMPSPSPSSAEPWRVPDPLALIVGGWLLVAALLSLRYLVQRRRAMRRIGPRHPVTDDQLNRMLAGLCRAGRVRHPVRLTSASGLSSPVALGRAEIVVPEAALTDLDLEQQRGMLAHELAHLVRRDPWWLAAACMMERVFFLQPLNRLARRRMQEAAEFLCDDWAVRSTGSGFSLASCLVKVAEWVDTRPRPVPLAGMAEHRSQLATRIHRLIEGRTMQTTPRSLWFAAGSVILLGITAVAAPGVTPNRHPAESAAPVAEEAVWPDLAAFPADTDTVAVAPEADTRRLDSRPALAPVDRSLRRLEQEMARNSRRSMSRAMSDARKAELEARLMSVRAPVPPGAPLAPPARMTMPAIAGVGVNWGRDRQERDTTGIAVPALVSALKDSDVEVRRAAARSLSNIADRRAVPGLIVAMKDSDAEVRGYSAMALGELRDDRAVPALVAALKDNSAEVRHQALRALEEMPAAVPDEAVIAALSDPDAEVREAALGFARSRMSHEDEDGEVKVNPRILDAFLKLLADPSADVRQEAVSAVGSAGLKQAPPALLPLARDRNPDVRQSVAEALGEIRDPRAVPTLKELLQDGNSDVREAAIEALSEIRDRSALEALVGALKSTDPEVRRAAASALGQREW